MSYINCPLAVAQLKSSCFDELSQTFCCAFYNEHVTVGLIFISILGGNEELKVPNTLLYCFFA